MKNMVAYCDECGGHTDVSVPFFCHGKYATTVYQEGCTYDSHCDAWIHPYNAQPCKACGEVYCYSCGRGDDSGQSWCPKCGEPRNIPSGSAEYAKRVGFTSQQADVIAQIDAIFEKAIGLKIISGEQATEIGKMFGEMAKKNVGL